MISKAISVRFLTCFLLATFLFTFKVEANNPHFKNYTAIDGISSTEIYDITQDNQGYMWFATDRGLTRYDGITFKQYTTSDGLLDNVVYNFFEQEDGTIWCSTSNNQIFYFKNADEGFKPYINNAVLTENSIHNGIMNNIVVANNEDIILTFINLWGYLRISESGTIINTLSTIENTATSQHILKTLKDAPSFITIDNPKNKKDATVYSNQKIIESLGDAIPFSRMISFPEYNKQIGILGNFCFSIDQKNKINKKMLPFSNEKRAISAGKYNENLFWVGYQYGGGLLIDTEGNIREHYLKDKSVTKIYKDHEGGVWIATTNAGVFYSKAPTINHHSFDSYPVELTRDNEKNLFVSFHNGDVLKKEINTDVFKQINHSKINDPAFVQYDFVNQNLTYGNQSIFEKYFTIGVSDDQYYHQIFNKHGIVIQNDSISLNIRIHERLYDISLNKENQSILIGTKRGLYQYQNNKLSSLSKKHILFSYRIFDIDHKENAMYMATMGAGLVIKKHDTIFSINKKKGLLSDISTEVLIEDKYTIWAGTNKGLNRITLYPNNTYSIDALTTLNGLSSSEIIDIEIIDDTVWISTKEGLFNFSKDIFKDLKKKRKKWLQINQMEVNGKKIADTNDYTFKYNKNNLKFHFKSISFKNGKNQMYRYKIRDKDTIWNYTTNNSVDFFNMSPGNYNLLLQVKSEDNTWEQTKELNFKILPPFWKSGWWYVLLIIFISIITYLSFIYKIFSFNKKLFQKLSWALIHKLSNRNDETLYVTFKSDGKEIRLPSSEIGYFKSSRNYVEVHTSKRKFVTRQKLVEFYDKLPDTINYIRLHRSYYIRIDKVHLQNGEREVIVYDTPIPVSNTYKENLNIIFKR